MGSCPMASCHDACIRTSVPNLKPKSHAFILRFSHSTRIAWSARAENYLYSVQGLIGITLNLFVGVGFGFCIWVWDFCVCGFAFWVLDFGFWVEALEAPGVEKYCPLRCDNFLFNRGCVGVSGALLKGTGALGGPWRPLLGPVGRHFPVQ